MHILHSLFSELKEEFVHSKKGEERGAWFICTLLAIILPFTSSRTSNLLRALKTLFGFVDIIYIHGIPKDTLGQTLAKNMENDTGTGDQ